MYAKGASSPQPSPPEEERENAPAAWKFRGSTREALVGRILCPRERVA